MNISDLKSHLNPEQKQAVEQIYGPILVLAGPGTGKTQMLTVRIAEILAQTDADPKNILCLTFTDSGAVAMRNRLQKWIGAAAYQVPISTFHSFCQRVMDDHEAIFLPKVQSRVLADDLAKAQAYQAVIRSRKWEHFDSVYDEWFARRDFLGVLGNLKRENFSPEKLRDIIPAEQERLEADPENFYKRKFKTFQVGDWKPQARTKIDHKIAKMYELADLWEAYEKKLADNGYYDFDDQIQWVVTELQNNENLRFDLQEQYQWILVDEYQDTNASQNEIIWQLTEGVDDPNLFAVGDDDQSIYRFQGASVANIETFRAKFPTRTEINLIRNYRSHQDILTAAYASVALNENRADPDRSLIASLPRFLDKNGHSELDSESSISSLRDLQGTKSQIHRATFGSRYSEINWMVQKIQTLLDQNIPPHEIAILVRKNREIEELARELPKFGIPVSAQIFEDIFQNESVRILILMLQIFSTETNDEKLFDLLHAECLGIAPEILLELSLQKNKRDNRAKNLIEILLERFKEAENSRVCPSSKNNDRHSELDSESSIYSIDKKQKSDQPNLFSTTFEIKKANTSEQKKLVFGFFKPMWFDDFGFDIEKSRAEFMNDSHVYFVEESGQVIGAVQFFDETYEKTPNYICRLAVAKNYRRQGLGSKLITLAIKKIKSHEVFLSTIPRQLDFYKQFGFIEYKDRCPSQKNPQMTICSLKLKKKQTKIPELNNLDSTSAVGEVTFNDDPLQTFFEFFIVSRQKFWHLRPAVRAEKLLYESGLATWLTQKKRLNDWNAVRKFVDWIRAQDLKKIPEEKHTKEILDRINLHQELAIAVRPDPLPQDKQAVQIMTAHRSKGLEFEAVFVPGLVDKSWGNTGSRNMIPLPKLTEVGANPCVCPEKNSEDLNAEERRLFFVALTRAKAKFFGSYSQTDFGGRDKSPSIFWHELPDELAQTEIAENEDLELQKLLPVFFTSQEKFLTVAERELLQKRVESFVWSATSLQTYLDCPRKFLYQNLYQLPRRPLAPMALGVALHQALERFLASKKITANYQPEAGELEGVLLQEFSRAMNGQNLPQVEKDKLIEHGQKILEHYYEQKLSTILVDHPYGFELEYNFAQHHPSIYDIQITGKMDKIVYLDEAKKMAKIVDYKSGRPKPIKHGERLWRQLVFYDLLAKNSPGIKWQSDITELEFLTPDASSNELKSKTYQVTASDREQVMAELTEVNQKVLNLEFPTIANTENDPEIEYWNNFGRMN